MDKLVTVIEDEDRVQISMPRSHAEFIHLIVGMIGQPEYDYLAAADAKYAIEFNGKPDTWPDYFESNAPEITQNLYDALLSLRPDSIA